MQDRPLDDGTGVNLEFELSTSGDVLEYQIYAAPYKFTDIGALFNGPSSPVMVTESVPEFPLTISLLEGDTPVSPDLTVWVAVVPVDFSGNSITTDLVTASIQSIDKLQVDVEGAEYEILNSIDYKKININSLQFESKHFDGTFKEGEKLEKIKKKLVLEGYNLNQIDKENILAKK